MRETCVSPPLVGRAHTFIDKSPHLVGLSRRLAAGNRARINNALVPRIFRKSATGRKRLSLTTRNRGGGKERCLPASRVILYRDIMVHAQRQPQRATGGVRTFAHVCVCVYMYARLCGVCACSRFSDLISRFYPGQKHTHTRVCTYIRRGRSLVYTREHERATNCAGKRETAGRSARRPACLPGCYRRYFRSLFFRAHRRRCTAGEKKG